MLLSLVGQETLQEPLEKTVALVHTTETGNAVFKSGGGSVEPVDCRVCSVSLGCCMLFYSSALSILIAAIVIFPSL